MFANYTYVGHSGAPGQIHLSQTQIHERADGAKVARNHQYNWNRLTGQAEGVGEWAASGELATMTTTMATMATMMTMLRQVGEMTALELCSHLHQLVGTRRLDPATLEPS